MSEALTVLEQKRLVELEEAFELFNKTSVQLTYAYESLQNQVTELQAQLKATDQEKRRVAERLEQLLTLLPAGVIVLDNNSHIVEMNASAENILGKDALGRHWEVVVKNVFLTENDAGELVTHDNVAYQLSTSPLSMAQVENSTPYDGKILLIQDVTAAKDLQKHVARHQRLDSMGEMAASLAHQIRTPLASALLYVSQMSTAELTPEQQQKFLGKSLKSLKHLEALVKDMLQYAKGGKVHDQKLTVQSLIDNLKQAVEPLAKSTQSEVSFPSKLPGLVILGDQDALLTALQNLVDNAMNIVGQKVHVKVSVVQLEPLDEQKLDIVIEDNGPGLDDTMLEKIFEPFYTSRAQGTGLGLAVVRAVAEAHAGEAWVKSILGRGAAFGIRLPYILNEETA